ncbi:hypothetical protein D8674_009943 [Pyrus ussuriensis x Pyrus communis]|uniref:Uncharacterized protein n=1 Tax=Pyrus ussuriensis x Pyrus communis TaxID=2448454 RepID=A0A5N5FEK8_9ROSA|nr:hypothetical protein D8674_009943 [Pyrus ussuriensis x Pyrus communis]
MATTEARPEAKLEPKEIEESSVTLLKYKISQQRCMGGREAVGDGECEGCFT